MEEVELQAWLAAGHALATAQLSLLGCRFRSLRAAFPCWGQSGGRQKVDGTELRISQATVFVNKVQDALFVSETRRSVDITRDGCYTQRGVIFTRKLCRDY